MSIRILHVVTSMDAGGIETMLMNLYRNIDREKVQFDFLVNRTHKGFYDDEIISLGGKIYKLMPIRLTSINKYVNKLKDFFDNHKEYKIIHSHISVMSYLILKVAKKKKIELRIAHSHEAHKSIREHRLFRRPIIVFSKLFINKYTTHRFACSKEAGKWLFGNKDDIKVINNTIDAKRYVINEQKRLNKREELDAADKFIIGHIGNFSKAKNYPFILDVFKSIVKQNSNALLILVGKNESNPEIEKKVKEMGLEKQVIFTGVRADVPELLQAMDVFLFPSLYEGLGVAVIEAQASGLPCIVSDSVPEEVKITDLVEFISRDQSPKYWGQQVLKYVNDYERKNIFEEICSSGYDIKENVKWLENFYIEEYNKIS